MSLYNETLKNIRNNKKRRISGDLIAIPWPSMSRLNTVLPGVEMGKIVIISANQKVGKTQLADFLYVYQVVDYLFNNRESHLSAKIKYFSLEMSKDAKMRQAMCYRLFHKYKVIISPQKLLSVFQNYIVDDEILKLIEAEKEWFDFFESIVEFQDEIRNAYGIYLNLETHMESKGSYTYKEIDFKDEFGKVSKKKVVDRYIPDNPNEFTIVITDHISLLQPERGDTLYTAIGKFSSEYCLKMRDRFNCTVVNVQQQAPTSEQQQFNYKGDTVIDKLKPTADCLGDNKSTARDANLMLSLFYPYRYNIEKYKGVNLQYENIGEFHRELMINLNRDGVSNASLQLYFNGASNYFKEFPPILDSKIYEYIIKNKQKQL